MSSLRLSGGENFISSAEIASRTEELGRYYTDLYAGEPLVIIGLLRGAARFAVHLAESIDNPNIYEDFMRTKKMNGAHSLGKVSVLSEPDVLSNPDIDISDMNFLVVEDIDDTRETLSVVLPSLAHYKPKRLDLVSLFNKPTVPKLVDELPCDDIQYGFDIENVFVVGHGLDWKGRYRALAHASAAHNIAEAGEPEFWVPIVPNEYRLAA